MAPYFETVKSFADVPYENGVVTVEFLEASDGFVNMFDLLGTGVFGFVQNDLRSNISVSTLRCTLSYLTWIVKGVRGRYQSASENSATLEALVTHESQGHDRYGTQCLVRLIRGLAFTCRALQNMQSDRSSELHVCFKRSYDVVLRKHHNFIIRSAVSVAIRAVPHRHDFYHRISQGGDIDKLDAEMKKWLSALDVIVSRMTAFLEQGGHGRV
ncbi:glycolipid transfer protein [Schizophyllum commune H4-8]|uniref:glycolipid transfer protein n=1 Tax=Schizophyllum commune (strain H4-8 / FGSC 9210) TaxID=578458 RepID=UPI00215F0799|nr:glycolipid transfer protein [Schizophyllum commune H4-8]KAI5893107.1 glycolipid transfer protein [Schizophyllum commune H4-8]